MKIIITENRVVKLVAEYIKSQYNDLVYEYDKEKDKVYWYKRNDEKHHYKFPYFEMNGSGTLYVPDDLKYTIADLFGFEYTREVDNAIMDAWELMYKVKPERIKIYFNI